MTMDAKDAIREVRETKIGYYHTAHSKLSNPDQFSALKVPTMQNFYEVLDFMSDMSGFNAGDVSESERMELIKTLCSLYTYMCLRAQGSHGSDRSEEIVISTHAIAGNALRLLSEAVFNLDASEAPSNL